MRAVVNFPQSGKYKNYRGKYRVEGGNDHAWSQPAVIPSQWRGIKDSFGIPFTEEMQWLSWNFSHYLNDLMTTSSWASTWAGDTWGTNNNGWNNENEPNDQRRDYVNDRYYGYPLPLVMDGVVFAGGLYRFHEHDEHLWATPGITGVDVNNKLPSVEEIVINGWYMRCTINGPNFPYDFSQGKGFPVYVPYFLTKETSYTPGHFELWERDFTPDPLTYYL